MKVLRSIMIFVLWISHIQFFGQDKPRLMYPENMASFKTHQNDREFVCQVLRDQVNVIHATEKKLLRKISVGYQIDESVYDTTTHFVYLMGHFEHRFSVYDISTGQLVRDYPINSIVPLDLIQDPDGRILLLAQLLNGSVELIDAKSDISMKKIPFKSDESVSGLLSPKGNIVLCYSFIDSIASIYNLRSDNIQTSWKSKLYINDYGMDAGGNYTALLTDPKTLSVIDNFDFHTIFTIPSANGRYELLFPKEENWLVTYPGLAFITENDFFEDTISIYDIRNGTLIDQCKVNQPIGSIVYDHDLKRMYCGTYNEGVYVWDLNLHRFIDTLDVIDKNEQEGRGGYWRPYSIYSNSDNNELMITGADNYTVVYHEKTLELIKRYKNGIPKNETHVQIKIPDLDFIAREPLGGFQIKQLGSGKSKSIALETKLEHAKIICMTDEVDSYIYFNDQKELKVVRSNGNVELLESLPISKSPMNIEKIKDNIFCVTVMFHSTSSPFPLYQSEIWDISRPKKITTLHASKLILTHSSNYLLSYYNNEVKFKIYRLPDFTLVDSLILSGPEDSLNITNKQEYLNRLNIYPGPSENDFIIKGMGKKPILRYDVLTNVIDTILSNNNLNLTTTIVFAQDSLIFQFADNENYHFMKITNAYTSNVILSHALTKDYPFYKDYILKDNYWYYQIEDSVFVFDVISKSEKYLFSSLGKIFCLHENIIACVDHRTIHFYDLNTKQVLFDYIPLDNQNWMITHPSGLFDASPDAMKEMYFVQGNEIIDFEQLKARYWEPGLWEKCIKGESLRQLRGLDEHIPLYPDIRELRANEKGELAITLDKRDGGYGKVKILINGKEISDDTRGGNTIDTTLQSLHLKYSIKDNPFVLNGQENEIEVFAYEKENWLASRGFKLTYTPEKSKEIVIPDAYIISIGTSDYTGDQIDLKFAAKDARDLGDALNLAAGNLFGQGKVFSYQLISSSQQSDLLPQKDNIQNVFSEIGKKAKAEDVLIVYLSGHGINLGGAEGDFYYLTQEAYATDPMAYQDPLLRKSCTISSAELTDWINQIPALKQVLIIDACASGRVVEDLMAMRDGLSSSTIRALDRMKDRTGMHILTGSAADAVSYEANRYGQGVLTYSLLEGIKGTALRENMFIDVNQLFQYARERVPVLAAGIGGIQQPSLISPYGASSFDIGKLDERDRKSVRLASIKPVFTRSVFFDQEEMNDSQGLSALVDDALSDHSSKGTESTYQFVDARDFPDACKISGGYTVKDATLILTLKIVCDGDKIQKTIVGKSGEILEQIIQTVEEVAGK